jgi:hypothetical protein
VKRWVVAQREQGEWWEFAIVPAASKLEAIATARRYSMRKGKQQDFSARRHIVTAK